MNNITAFFLIFTIFVFLRPDAKAQTETTLIIVPKPKLVKSLPEKFELNPKTKIVANTDETRKLASFLNDYLLKFHGFKLEVVKKLPKNNSISFEFNAGTTGPEDETYNLYVSKNVVRILAKTHRGFFYGLQSFIQLLPPDFKNKTEISGVDIEDEPRFRYRGMHLDVGRHFFPVSFIKKYLDLMAQYKFNYFHWHLTEDQGWRIEIKKYPKLTQIGGFRKETVKEKNLQPYIGDGIPYGSFYTQEEIKDIVNYAKERFITVVPEIELPGHSSAALAAYPELGCKTDYEYKVQTTWGIFKEVYCPTEKTFQFLEDVISEVVTLFPDSPYIHIGGDEVLKDHWKESAFVQELKQKENLKDEHEVQSYFIRRMEKFINSKGKRIIGWDEILEGGLAPNAIVMSWRGEKGGIEAAKAKHEVIMTPTTHLYFDYGQGDPKTEPINIGSFVPLETVYNYNPIPKELTEDEAKYVLGAQGNVWTEYMKTPEKVEYMAFPRMMALSEVVWSPQESKNYIDFLKRLPFQFQKLDKQNVQYRIPEPIGLNNVISSVAESVKLDLRSLINNGKIYYTTDGSEPDEKSNVYTAPVDIKLNPNGKKVITAVVVTSSGRRSSLYTATLLRREMLKPADPFQTTSGVRFMVFKGQFQSVKDVDKKDPDEMGETKSIQLPQFAKKTNDLKDPFGVIFDGYFYAPKDEIYEFNLESDDGAVFIIGDEAIVDLDGVHNMQNASGIVPLKKGLHKFRLKYFQAGNNAALNLRWGIKGQGLKRVFGPELFR
jgi:hexosaminidase